MKEILKISFIFFFLLSTTPVLAGTLSSSVVTGDCPVGQTTVFKMSAMSNAHAGLASSSYPISVCVSGISGLSNSCSGTFATIVKFSGLTNAHTRQGDQDDYPGAINACLSVPAGGTISVGYQANNCSGFDTTLASMSQFPTNAHVGDSNAYLNKICVSITQPEQLGSVILINNSNNSFSSPVVSPISSTLPLEESLLEETLRVANSAEEVFIEFSESSEPNEVFNAIPLTETINLFPKKENIFSPTSILISPEELTATTLNTEIPQIKSIEEKSPKVGLLASVSAAVDFPPKDFLDYSLFTVLIVLLFISLRSFLRLLKKIIS